MPQQSMLMWRLIGHGLNVAVQPEFELFRVDGRVAVPVVVPDNR